MRSGVPARSPSADRRQQASLAKYSLDAYEAISDCDSEGNDPPQIGEFINPLTLDETAPPPKGPAQESRLPLSAPAEQRRVREAYEPPINYEDWVEGEDALAAGRAAAGANAANSRRDVRRLEEDSDFPLARPYAHHAFCPTCSRQYHPVVPSGWKCLRCSGPVWQQPTDPDSKHCAVCRRRVAKNRKVLHMKIQNPLALNPHVCKRCGRIVCDQCYSPVPVDVSEYGFKGPQKVCTTCINDMAQCAQCPDGDDLGTLHDEDALLEADDEANMLPYWPPRCLPCSTSTAKPPRRWECEMCKGKMWQPLDAPDSETCWICDTAGPQSRCHRCGQLTCKPCGAYAQPLPEMGYTDGAAVSVCAACYTGIATCVVPSRYERMVADERRVLEPRCSQCRAPQSYPPPPMWVPSCHKGAKCWEVGSKECALCTTPITEATAQNCRSCGHQVCVPCAQYRCPLPGRGFPRGEGQTVCRACFHPKEACMPDHCDTRQWRPYCPTCLETYDSPPPRWRCVNECGNVWQPIAHVASLTCHCCGGKVTQPVNCRRCGRIVCAPCGAKRTELVDMGFTRGQDFPTCTKCVDWAAAKAGDAAERARREQSAAEAERQARLANAPPATMGGAGAPPRFSHPPQGISGAPPPGIGFKGPPPGVMPKGPPPGFVPMAAPGGMSSQQGVPSGQGSTPGWKGPPPGMKGPPPGWKGPPPGLARVAPPPTAPQ